MPDRAVKGFTLIELLVVIAIIAVLIGLLLPAVQQARESASRADCSNNLKQIALAAANYELQRGSYPPGLAHPGSDGRYTSLFVEILPLIEQQGLYDRWDLGNPGINFQNSPALGPGAAALRVFFCPSDRGLRNPSTYGNQSLGLTTYAGNGGTLSWPDTQASADGLFHECGPMAKPSPGQRPVKAAMVTDGLSNTLFFGERNPADVNMDSYQTAPFSQPPDPPILAMTAYCGWGSPPGPSAIVSVAFSGAASVNFTYPHHYEPPLTGVEVPLNWNDYKDDWRLRLAALGSRHPGLANVAFADGSVKFLRNDISLATLQAMCTRAGGEAPGINLRPQHVAVTIE